MQLKWANVIEVALLRQPQPAKLADMKYNSQAIDVKLYMYHICRHTHILKHINTYGSKNKISNTYKYAYAYTI